MKDSEPPIGSRGQAPVGLLEANKSVCQDKATLIFHLKILFLYIIIIMYYNSFFLKFITSFKNQQKKQTSPTNLLLLVP